MFCGFIFTFQILTQDQYYSVIQNPTLIRNYCFYFLAAMLGLLILSIYFIYSYKLRFRLENVYKSICWYKWLFWVCEWSMLPLMFNVAWFGNCQFKTQRQAIVLPNCKKDGNHWPNVMIICFSVSFFIVFIYNMVLLYIVNKQKISIATHEA